MKQIRIITLATLSLLSSMVLEAREKLNVSEKTATETVLSNNCLQSNSIIELAINNVRLTLLGGGDFWWDLNNAKYEVPAGTGKHSVFAGAIWVGGLGGNGNLKLAAQTYRQTGNDFWSGPLDPNLTVVNSNGDVVTNPNYGTTDIDQCNAYDRHFSIRFSDVEAFVANCENPDPTYTVPASILNWPGNGVPDAPFDGVLAPFVDQDEDGVYEPLEDCDYPAYNVGNLQLDCEEDDVLFGDQTIFWVYNDRGNIHTETQGEDIGLEIRAQAFGFATNDEINDMSFYKFKIINRATEALEQTYFGFWVDSDIGFFSDDYVGCDVNRGLGYTYNGDANDEGVTGYGDSPPALGLDFFEGPLADPGDGVDNDRDGCTDCTFIFDEDGNQIGSIADTEPGGREKIIMSKFIYYNNDFSDFGNPEVASDFYGYLTGRWKNGNPLTYGEDGQNTANPPADFMFPNTTDPSFTQPWTEEIAGNTPADRRLLVTAGPFTLDEGAVNNITGGLVWARASTGGPFASVNKLLVADDKAQALFDNCFDVLSGPPAPEMIIQELDKELVITLMDDENSPYFNGEDGEVDPLIASLSNVSYFVSGDAVDANGDTVTAQFLTDTMLDLDDRFRFEGYMVFQLKDISVNSSDIYDPAKARLIYQTDVQNFRPSEAGDPDLTNPITQLSNIVLDGESGKETSVNLAFTPDNQGIQRTFRVTQDAFTNQRLVNNRKYYFLAVAYAYNEYMPYQPDAPFGGNKNIPNSLGQKTPFKLGSGQIEKYTGRPHLGAEERSEEFGYQFPLTRLQGYGSGGNTLDFEEEELAIIREDYCPESITYAENAGPIDIGILNPETIDEADYIFEIYSTDSLTDQVDDTDRWRLIRNPGTAEADTFESRNAISVLNEEVIPEWGIYVDVSNQLKRIFEDRDANNGFISSSIQYENDRRPWLGLYLDADYPQNLDWIKSGNTSISLPGESADRYNQTAVTDVRVEQVRVTPVGNDTSFAFVDPGQIYENVLSGGIAPVWLTESRFGYPAYDQGHENTTIASRYEELSSIKIVLTDDRSMWTRVPVINTSDYSTIPSRLKKVKRSPSKDINGNEEAGFGWSWFPGYAVDKQRGTRLNMMFGEDPTQPEKNGDDMLWNPTVIENTDDVDPEFIQDLGIITYTNDLSGRHYVYVCRSTYRGSDETQHPLFEDINELASIEADDVRAGERSELQNVMQVDAMWAMMPAVNPGFGLLDNDVEIDVDVVTPLRKINPVIVSSTTVNEDLIPVCNTDVTNDNLPKYGFTTRNLERRSDLSSREDADSPLDLVSVFPNPYKGGSGLDRGQLDQRVRITNLPENTTINIFNAAGLHVRQARVESQGFYDWDLNNKNNIKVASGLYFMHIEHAGETKVIKWVGSLRTLDLDTI